MKRSVNLNRAKKSGRLNASNTADLLAHFGVTAAELRAYARKNAGDSRKRFTCPRCNVWVEAEVNNFDGAAVCPSCENEVQVQS